MNQCRKCHITCYTCIDENQNTCLSCIDPTFLLVNEYGSFCVENCEYYGLTSSKINGNLCVEFEADAVLINVSEDVPINRKEFNYIEEDKSNFLKNAKSLKKNDIELDDHNFLML